MVWVFLTVCDISFTGTYVFCWQFVTLVPLPLFCMCSVWLFRSLVSDALFWLCSLWFFCHVSVLRTVLNVFCWSVHHVSAPHNVLYVFCWQFVTFGCRTLVFMCSVDFLSRKCLAHCFVLVFFLLFVTLVPCALFCMLCSIVWFVNALRTVLTLFFKTFCYVSVLCTVLNVFCRLLRSSVVHCFLCVPFPFCRSNFFRTVWYEFSSQFVTLRSCPLFCMCCVACLWR